ncbi:hypothetical protein ACFY05_32305 [Microtetraspora fusca]|uniref:Terminase n=1 Tax=Microtetraspora fusca TaxID=1997 RepID=A0ABW6VE87_MICFU
MALAPEVRRGFLQGLTQADLAQVLTVAAREGGTPYALWVDDPVGFVTDVLGENTWSKPREILAALPHVNKVAVPSCYASGKTWSASRAALWMSMVHPPGTVKVITLAPTWRQVVRLLWSEVRFAHARAKLPGVVDMAQLKVQTASGMDVVVAYGLSAAPWNEASVQGIHAPRLLLIVDEAGGISHVIGRNLSGMVSTEGSHMLAIGNPPSDEEASWFEGLCEQDGVKVIPISAYDTPALSGEDAPICRTCQVPNHRVTKHLVKPSWVEEIVSEHGGDSNYCVAKVHARFPRGGPSRAIPSSWVDAAFESEEPDDEEWTALADLGLPEERERWRVRPGAWIRLGVDVAADGGDEFVVARAVGDLLTIEHRSAGADNDNAITVAGVVLEHIRRAEELRRVLGTEAKIRVKVDGIGVGWGVAGVLQAWASEGIHDAEIVPVVVSEDTGREPESATMRPYRKRDEMWLALRSLLQPGPGHESGRIRLRVDHKTLAQLRAPKRSTTMSGYTVIESKKSLRERGLHSPDRAEAALLAIYEEAPKKPKRKKARLVNP